MKGARLLLASVSVILAACSSRQFAADASPPADAAPDTLLDEVKNDAGVDDAGAADASSAADVVDEQLLDAPDDVAPDAGELDATPDAIVDAAPDVAQGGDYCPIFGQTHCGLGFAFRTHPDGGQTDYNCGAVTPNCPTGWVCWSLNNNNQPVYAVCP